MTDINGVPITAPTQDQPGTAIAQVPITMDGNQNMFEVSLRAPGIVRACSFWLREPKVLMSASRGAQPIPQPLLFVECRSDGEMVRRRFVFAPSEAIVGARDGHTAKYVATATMLAQGGLLAAHLFEIVEVAS